MNPQSQTSLQSFLKTGEIPEGFTIQLKPKNTNKGVEEKHFKYTDMRTIYPTQTKSVAPKNKPGRPKKKKRGRPKK